MAESFRGFGLFGRLAVVCGAVSVLCGGPSSAIADDIIYRCVRPDGEQVYSFNRKLDGMRCSVHETLGNQPVRPRGARCRTQRFRDTIFYTCEKDGVWYVFNRPVERTDDGGQGGRNQVRAAGQGGQGQSTEVVLSSLPAGASRVRNLSEIVAAAASEFGIPEALLLAVIEVESGFNPDVVSPVGAQGLMQLMPVTADYLDVDNPFDPAQNVRAGAKLIRILSDRFDGDVELVMAAYYAGAASVQRAGGVPESCLDYVNKVMDRYRRHSGAGR